MVFPKVCATVLLLHTHCSPITCNCMLYAGTCTHPCNAGTVVKMYSGASTAIFPLCFYNAAAVHLKIVETYRRLKECGGYELLQARGTSKFLDPVPQPPDGYSALYFKSMGQSRIFIRSIQKDLDTVSMSNPS